MELKETLIMPKGKFSMRANLAQKEPLYVEKFNKIELYQMLLKHNEGKPAFYLHDGPPYANNEIHAGHALNKIIKDIIVRSKNLEGFYVPYVPGWDTHGLPIENCVTKAGVDRRTTPPAQFRKKCREYALGQVDRQRSQMLRLGVVGDYPNPYLTLNKDYEADQVKIFGKMAMDGLIYKGLKPVNWSWSSESALAEAEIEYKDVKATTIYFKFPVVKGNEFVKEGDSILVWTTTGWTIPSNQGLCLNPKMEYGVFETEKGNFVMLVSLSKAIQEECHFEKMVQKNTFTGRDVEGVLVSHPVQNRLVPCCVDDYVTDDSGTGIVHLGPGHGADDYRVAKKYNLPIICTVDPKGYMIHSEEVDGMFYEDCSEKMLELLEKKGNLVATKEIVHAYPHDWRTKKPTIFRATDQWFFSVGKIKEKLLEEAEKVTYKPAWGKVRFENMLTGRDDWCISRQRLWGVPIPIFYGEDGEPLLDQVLFDHVEKLFREQGSDIWYEKSADELIPEGYQNPHSPNGHFTKEKDIMDVWFDSGSSWLGSDISLGNPFPADIYFEGNDQYRGWYNSSMILSVAYTGKSPYKNIITHGFIVDQNGEKFSKSKKNGIDPVTICNTFGADILRLWTTSIDYTTAEIKLTQDLLKVCSEQYRKIRNTFKFMLTNLDDDKEGTEHYDPSYQPKNLSLIDQMMLTKLNSVLLEMKRNYDSYNFANVTTALMNFIVNDLSSFYLDFSKDTLYCDEKNSERRRNTQYVLYTIIYSLAVAYSPILCFTCEEIYEYLPVSNERLPSIALASYPDLGALDEGLLEEYGKLIALRSHINSVIEPKRASGEIHSNSEAEVLYVPVEGEEKLIEKLSEEEIARVMNLSSFHIANVNDCHLAKGEKCDRCWNYFEDIQEVEGSHLCHRCKEAVEKLK